MNCILVCTAPTEQLNCFSTFQFWASLQRSSNIVHRFNVAVEFFYLSNGAVELFRHWIVFSMKEEIMYIALSYDLKFRINQRKSCHKICKYQKQRLTINLQFFYDDIKHQYWEHDWNKERYVYCELFMSSIYYIS